MQQRHVSVRPPAWTEALLRALLPPGERETLLSDLRDEYRNQVYATRGRLGALAWYVGQIGAVLRRDTQGLALVLLFAWVASGFLPSIPAAVLGADASTRGRGQLVLAAVLTLPSLVMAAGGARAGWRTESPWAGLATGFVLSLGFGLVLLVAYVAGIALGQPQLLRFAFTPESLRAMASLVLTTTGTGTAVAAVGGFAGTAARRVMRPAVARR